MVFFLFFSSSLCLLVPLSHCLLIPFSPCLLVSVALRQFYLPAPGILHPQPLGLGGDERRNISTTASPDLIESPRYDRLCSGSLTNRYGSHLCGSLKFQFAGSAE